jgi:hypothetical protein
MRTIAASRVARWRNPLARPVPCAPMCAQGDSMGVHNLVVLHMLTVMLKEMVYSWLSVALVLWTARDSGEGNDVDKAMALLSRLTLASPPMDRISKLSIGISLLWYNLKPHAETALERIPWACSKSLTDQAWKAKFIEHVHSRIECALAVFNHAPDNASPLPSYQFFLAREVGDGTFRNSTIEEMEEMASIAKVYGKVVTAAIAAAAGGAEVGSALAPGAARSPRWQDASGPPVSAAVLLSALGEIGAQLGPARRTSRSRVSVPTTTRVGKRARPSEWVPPRAPAPPPPHAAV